MIQVRDLRIGNWYDQFGNYHQASWVTLKDLTNTPESQLWCKAIPLTEEWLVRFGGERLPHPSVLKSINFNIGRNRIISTSNVGTPNEMIWICEVNESDPKKIDDLVCVHNYDYDGYMTVHKFQNLYYELAKKELELIKTIT